MILLKENVTNTSCIRYGSAIRLWARYFIQKNQFEFIILMIIARV